MGFATTLNQPAGPDDLRPSALSGTWRSTMALWAIVLLVFIAHLLYLTIDCPIDLAEDEAYYWDWSRQLDICFYSKGPMAALLIRAGCLVAGDTPLGVRLPALLLRAGIALCTFWLARRLFRDVRVALGAVLLGYLTPMLVAAGLVMTTDPAFLFFWAIATCFGTKAVLDRSSWAWPLAGAAVGVGMLTKFSTPLWVVGLLLFLLIDRASRPLLRTWGPYVAILMVLPFFIPILLWNSRHSWVTFLHVHEDVGAAGGVLRWKNVLDFWTGQMGVIGPLVFLLVLAAVVFGAAFAARRPTAEGGEDEQRGVRLLLCLGLPVFLGVMMISFRKHAADNWVASSYFPWLILTAWFIVRQASRPWRWRWWRLAVYPALAVNLALVLIAHHTELLYPLVAWHNARFPERAVAVRKIDPTYRLHGWAEIGEVVGGHLHSMPEGTLVMAGDYQTTAELGFYVPGQPRTFCAGSYFYNPADREPFSQYDIWLDRRLDRELLAETGLGGRDALYVGPMNEDLRSAFDRVQRLEDIVIVRRGLEVRRLQVWRCHEFRGLPWPGWEGRYNK